MVYRQAKFTKLVFIEWKFINEKSKESQSQIDFWQFKTGKRLKVSNEESKVVPNEDDLKYFSEFEKKIVSGRFILDKTSKFQLSAGSQITSCDLN